MDGVGGAIGLAGTSAVALGCCPPAPALLLLLIRLALARLLFRLLFRLALMLRLARSRAA